VKQKDGGTTLPYTDKKKGPKPKQKETPNRVTDVWWEEQFFGKQNDVGSKGSCSRALLSYWHPLNEQKKVTIDFARDHPKTSVRQVAFKFSEVVTRVVPACAGAPEKRFGRAVSFFLRPRLNHYLPVEEQPKIWEKHAKENKLA